VDRREQRLALITQQRIQDFCWYQLPVKWLIGIEGKLRVAEGLAQVLDLLQLLRHAAICRSQTTREKPRTGAAPTLPAR
jgi:hypothetical protein